MHWYPRCVKRSALSSPAGSRYHHLQRTINDNPEKTHSLIYLVELLERELPQQNPDSLFIINRIGVTVAYPHNLSVVLEQYNKVKTPKIIAETKEILTGLMQKSSKW